MPLQPFYISSVNGNGCFAARVRGLMRKARTANLFCEQSNGYDIFLPRKIYGFDSHFAVKFVPCLWSIPLNGQEACLSRRKQRVRVPYRLPTPSSVRGVLPPRGLLVLVALSSIIKTHDISGVPTCGVPLNKWLIGRAKVPVINRCAADNLLFFFSGCGAVGSARRLGRRCRRFESCHSDQYIGWQTCLVKASFPFLKIPKGLNFDFL